MMFDDDDLMHYTVIYRLFSLSQPVGTFLAPPQTVSGVWSGVWSGVCHSVRSLSNGSFQLSVIDALLCKLRSLS